MADYFTHVSVGVPMCREHAEWIETLHTRMLAKFDSLGEGDDDEPEADDPRQSEFEAAINALIEHEYGGLEEVEYQKREEKPFLWLQGYSVNTDYLAGLLQQYLIHFDLPGPVGFEYACTCSKPRLDAFGGGAVVVTKTEITSESSGQWLQEQMEAFQ